MDSTRIKSENQGVLPQLPPSTGGFDVIGLGESSVDLVIDVARFPEPDSKVRAEALARHPGGQVATAIRALSRLGWRTGFVGSVGDDDEGRLLHRVLQADGVDVTASPRKSGVVTRGAVILVDRAQSTRTVIEHRDPRLDLLPAELPEQLIASARVILLDGTDTVAACAAAAVARAAGVPVVVDIDEGVRDEAGLLQLADVVITSEGYARRAGHGHLGTGLDRLRETCHGASVVCVTLGRGGAQGWTTGGWVRVPAFDVPCVDTTGAGDVFRAGFIAAWLAGGADVAEALRYGCAAAGLSCGAPGAQGALPTADAVRALLDSGRVVATR